MSYIIVILFFLILIWLIASCIHDSNEKRLTEEYLKSIEYQKVVCSNFKALFGYSTLHKRITTSRNLVDNFDNKTYDYLKKYFGLVINDETLEHISNVYKIQKKAEDFVKGKSVREKTLEEYTPSFSMYYVSPQGRSSLESIYTFDTTGLRYLNRQVKHMLEKQNHTKAQRSAMTTQMRESILRRDNWTCQRCGNSVYKEPNLLLEVDHIVPISKGGKTEPNNLQTLCWKCNRSKSDKIAIPSGNFEREQEVVFPDDNVY